MPDRVVDEDHDQLAEARRVAPDHRGLRVHGHVHAALLGRPAEGGRPGERAGAPGDARAVPLIYDGRVHKVRLVMGEAVATAAAPASFAKA